MAGPGLRTKAFGLEGWTPYHLGIDVPTKSHNLSVRCETWSPASDAWAPILGSKLLPAFPGSYV